MQHQYHFSRKLISKWHHLENTGSFLGNNHSTKFLEFGCYFHSWERGEVDDAVHRGVVPQACRMPCSGSPDKQGPPPKLPLASTGC